MKRWLPLFSVLLFAAASAEEITDWRLEVLKENGLSSETKALEEFQNGLGGSGEELDQWVRQLGSREYQKREQAQKEILLFGKKVIPQLRPMLKSDQAEVRMRINGIIGKLEAGGRWEKEDLLRHAVASLLQERKNPGAANRKPGPHVEFFSQGKHSIADGYGRMNFVSDVGASGSVREGVLRLHGNREGDGDQRLLLLANEVTGKPEFPDSFRIEVKIGGEMEEAGGYHVGISVGNVRVLFHPGYHTGGFRLEQVSDNTAIVNNQDMGFDPPAGKLLRMNIDVKRLRDRDVEIGVIVTSGKDTYRISRVVKADVVGKLDGIGLDRSGRGGGDAMFDDLIVGVE